MEDNRLLEEVIKEKIKDYELYRKLYSSNFPLQGPFEAYYFCEVRKFFENSISHRIMEHNQDIPPKLVKKR